MSQVMTRLVNPARLFFEIIADSSLPDRPPIAEQIAAVRRALTALASLGIEFRIGEPRFLDFREQEPGRTQHRALVQVYYPRIRGLRTQIVTAVNAVGPARRYRSTR